MKSRLPELTICLNGGVTSLSLVRDLLAQGLDGVMIGRQAYHDPASVLLGADALWDTPGASPEPPPVSACLDIARAMEPYIAEHLASGGRLHQVTRHMLGLFTGRPGARGFRRVLSEGASRPGAGLDLWHEALAQVAG